MTHSNTPTKQCTSCGEIKPVSEFHRRTKAKDGLQHRCKSCNAEYGRAWYEDNRERRAETARAWQEENRGRRAETNRAWYENNRERVAETARAWHENNRERRAKTARARSERNRGRHDDFLREWGDNEPPTRECTMCGKEMSATTEFFHRHHVGKYGLASRCKTCKAEDSRAWQRTNRERHAKNARNARARKAAAEGNHTAQDVEKQYKAQRGRCYYAACGHSKLGDTYHVDHLIPLSRGGTNDPSNLIISCPTCNLKKGTRFPHEWAEGGRLL